MGIAQQTFVALGLYLRTPFKPFLCIWLLLATSSLLGQNKQDQGILAFNTYDAKDGLEVGDIHSLVYDNNGWLWISGLESDLGASAFLQNIPKLQWFDGYNFHSVSLPISEDISPNIFILNKRADGLFYLRFSSARTSDYLYLFNPSSFEFQQIPISNKGIDVKISNLFVQGNTTFIALDTAGETYLYLLNEDLSLHRFFRLRTEGGESYLYQVISFEDHFLVSEARTGIIAYALNGEIIKEFDYEDFSLEKTDNQEVLALADCFWFEEAFEFVLKSEKEIYRYNDQNMTWSKSNLTKPSKTGVIKNDLYQKLNAINDSFGNIALLDATGDQVLIKREFINQANQKSNTIVKVNNITNVASQNLKKELYLAELGRLVHIVFKNTGVHNFLEGFSVRSIAHYKESKYLVGTEVGGLYLIDVDDKTEEPFPIFMNGQPFSASEVRGLFISENNIWTNYNEGVLLIDLATHEVERFRHYPISAMVDDGDRIVYGAATFPLMEFDKVNKANKPLSANDSLVIMDLAKFGGSFYATTKNGLFTFKDGNEAFIDTPVEPDKLMMLDVIDEYGLMITTSDGRVYQMSNENKEPILLYTDPAASPIASVFKDEQSNFWFATFSGLIKYNPQTQTSERYVEDDGFSNNEFNRYSMLQTADGGVFLGAIRGLNFFYPTEVRKIEKGGRVVLTSLTYFDIKTNANTNITAIGDLAQVKNISLPAENKFLKIQLAPNGLTQPVKVNMEFRLNNGEWLPIKQPGEIQFDNLAAGQYRLAVRMVDSEGLAFGEELELRIHAQEFFYRTIWFLLLCGLLIITISYYFIRQANKAKRLEQHYSRTLLKVQEEERMRISRDLHDSVGQQLILLKNQANASKNEEIIKNVSATLDEVRSITRNLHPVVLSRLGLTAALEELIRKLDENTKVFFSTELENIDGIFKEDEELNLYRIIQEALNNIVKHANAASARLSIENAKGKILINIQDNGRGFIVEQEQQSGTSLGLKTLQERIAMLNGKVNIVSGETGTIISLIIPK